LFFQFYLQKAALTAAAAEATQVADQMEREAKENESLKEKAIEARAAAGI
jgi:hypothetical protein